MSWIYAVTVAELLLYLLLSSVSLCEISGLSDSLIAPKALPDNSSVVPFLFTLLALFVFSLLSYISVKLPPVLAHSSQTSNKELSRSVNLKSDCSCSQPGLCLAIIFHRSD